MTKGIHHITAIAGSAQRNYDFYTKVLGLRLVKKTVNFDDPGTYHFYFANETGDPGTVLTFFPWEGIAQGKRGVGQATETGFAVPVGSLGFWEKRLEAANVTYNKPAEKFGQRYLTLLDPDGLKLELTETEGGAKPYIHPHIGEENAIRGFANATLTLEKADRTADLLTSLMGYRLAEQHVNRFRLVNDAAPHAGIIDLVEAAGEGRGRGAGGTVHHVAFRVSNDADEMALREKIVDLGFNITHQIDRQYFHSLYFREPGGVLFEIATDNPGFDIDEPVATLGQALKLPAQYEPRRSEIEKVLPPLVH
jgi:glyoxalase family protein